MKRKFNPRDDAGKGLENVHVMPRDLWLESMSYDVGPWIAAARKIDKCKHRGKCDCKVPLVELLQGKFELPSEARLVIADLLERRQLKRKPGKQATPLYELPPAAKKWVWAIMKIKDYRRRDRMSVKAAVAKASREEKLDEAELGERYARGLPALNRKV